MSSVRRSTRLSNIDNSTPATPKRRTQLWRSQQQRPKYHNDDDTSEDETSSEDLENSNVLKIHNRKITKKTEPSAAANKMSTKHKRQTSKTKAAAVENSTNELEQQQQLECSPPKVKRQAELKILPKHLISPSRLLARLSIDQSENEEEVKVEAETEERNKPSTASTEEKQQSPKRNKYQNARRVLNSAETQNLPGRESQLQELREFFSSHLKSQKAGSLYVSGQPGTGKTACLSYLLRSPEFVHQFKSAYINCTSIASIGSVYKKLCTELKINVHGRTERDHLDAIRRHLCHTKQMVLIVLDEIDQLCSSRQSVLYTIFEWPALPGARLLLIGIANSLDLTDRALIRLNARVELKPKLMHFPPYTKQQIVEIFRSRLAEADVLDVFPPVTLQLLAAKVSAVSGDVRRALDIGRRVVEIAEQKKKAGERLTNLNDLNLEAGEQQQQTEDEATLKPVQVTQVVEVLNKVYGASQNLEADIEASFPLQQKLMLCTLMLMLRNEKNKDLTIGRLHEVYRRVCQKRNICALDQAEFAGLVDLIETRGILRLIRKKEPRLSKVQLQWDEDEVHAALCDKQLIATILNDTACLRSAH